MKFVSSLGSKLPYLQSFVTVSYNFSVICSWIWFFVSSWWFFTTHLKKPAQVKLEILPILGSKIIYIYINVSNRYLAVHPRNLTYIAPEKWCLEDDPFLLGPCLSLGAFAVELPGRVMLVFPFSGLLMGFLSVLLFVGGSMGNPLYWAWNTGWLMTGSSFHGLLYHRISSSQITNENRIQKFLHASHENIGFSLRSRDPRKFMTYLNFHFLTNHQRVVSH